MKQGKEVGVIGVHLYTVETVKKQVGWCKVSKKWVIWLIRVNGMDSRYQDNSLAMGCGRAKMENTEGSGIWLEVMQFG